VLEELLKIIRNKNILILGYGREGQATYNLLRKYFPDLHITIADKQSTLQCLENDNNLSLKLGEHYLENLNQYNLIIKTPGIPIHKLSVDIPAENITSQTDIFLKLFSKQTIGITGTKGKSTTSSLIHHIISLNTLDTLLVGNIGVPPFSLMDRITPATKIVYELSCHQLNDVRVSPHIAILLNIFQEHLDYYKSYEDYQQAKMNIARFQKADDHFIYNADNKVISGLLLIANYQLLITNYQVSLIRQKLNGCLIKDNKIIFCKNDKEELVYDLNDERFLKGEHNLLNIMAAIIACKISDVPNEIISKGINSFRGLKHRMEYVGKYNNIHFYNDSIATIPEATIEAIKALKDVDTLILGGYDRGIDYSELVDFIIKSPVRNIIFLGNAGERILEEFKIKTLKLKISNIQHHTFLVTDMAEAVKIAKLKTRQDSICLLSPAAASYGMFKDFEDRGDKFVELVTN
jgi:UDP-N-acetylmuramoylalanine--D-glutamate ligase